QCPGALRVDRARSDPARRGPGTVSVMSYLSGFGNEHATEAVKGALPEGCNSPQRVPHGLYAEQLSGTAFTAPRSENRRSWLYRIRPAAMHQPFQRIQNGKLLSAPFDEIASSPNQLRWDPFPLPTQAGELTAATSAIAD